MLPDLNKMMMMIQESYRKMRAMCATSVHNTTQNSSDNLLSYLQTTTIAQMLYTGGKRGISGGEM